MGQAMAGNSVVSDDGGYKYVRAPFEIAPGTTKTFTASCPGRTRVLAGGATQFGDFGDAYLSSSYPFDGGDADEAPDDGWKTKVTSFDAYVDGGLHAICARTDIAYRSHRYEIQPMISATDETVACPQGDAIVHGGFKGPTSVRPGSSFPIDNGSSDFWGLRPENVSDQGRSITGYAVCAGKLDVTYVSSASGPIATNTRAIIEPQCPGGAPNVVGGGPTGTGEFGAIRLAVNAPDAFAQPLSDEWTTYLENEGTPASYTVWADCVADL